MRLEEKITQWAKEGGEGHPRDWCGPKSTPTQSFLVAGHEDSLLSGDSFGAASQNNFKSRLHTEVGECVVRFPNCHELPEASGLGNLARGYALVG